MKNFKNSGTVLLFILFFLYLTFWLVLNLFFPSDSEFFNYFTDTYGIIAAVGGICGYLASRKWGGFRSVMGRSLAFFSAALFFQFLGQIIYAIYFYAFHIENAYPSIGDFFYFGSIPLYIAAIILLFKVLQIDKSVHKNFRRIMTVFIPLLLVSISYCVFLKDYQFDPSSPITTFLDFGFPFGGAIVVGLTVVAFLFSSSTLGGKLKKNTVILFIALIAQYFADTTYLVHTMNGTWRAGGLDDLFYLSAYAAMGFTLIAFGRAAESFLSRTEEKTEGQLAKS